ncbi:MAG: type I-E CRISPR-associated protein Cse1/CasA [Chthoniobacteraceae bacterium]|nr:type I-E CRISPR-associated protein Cse1/CasA [Chthoniobacteraceae bacterium]
MTTFNLIDSPWLPVRDHRGRARLLGLSDLFSCPEAWAEVDVRPHERISIMRLLVCIAQAALGAPEDTDGWDEFGSDLSEKATAYLHQWRDGFNLLGDGPRFLQRRPVKEGEPVMISKLVPHLASGNNPCNNDHGGGELRPMDPAPLAMALLSFQNFYPLYGAGYKGRGPCVDGNMLHTLLRGSNLREVILANCLDQDNIDTSLGGMGRPIWELWPASSSDQPAVENARKTYLGRLVPLHRTVWICDNYTQMLVSKEGWEYPTFEEYLEPTATIISTNKGERRLLWSTPERAIWRDLHALTVLTRAAESHAAPLVIQSHQNWGEPKPLDIWTGALVTDGKAKILDVVESIFHLEDRLFTDSGRGLYEKGVLYAQLGSFCLRNAVRACGKAMMSEDPPVPTAERHYWHQLDQQCNTLLKVANDPATGALEFGPESRDDWSRTIRDALNAAYEEACPRQTPRQILAYTEGLRLLYPKPASKNKTKRRS